MNKIDPTKIFTLFQHSDEEIYKEHNMSQLMESPSVLMGMIITGLENYQIIDELHVRRYSKKYERVRDKVKLQYYDKLLKYLQKIDKSNSKEVEQVLLSFDIEQISFSLNEILFFYEKYEHYEKCSVVKKYYDTFCLSKNKSKVV